MEKNKGKIYICPTPIGNLEDISYRVLRMLNEVDFICAEDTRHSIKLLNHFGIAKPLVSYHEHNKYSKLDYIIERLANGENAAIVTDAGTPAISDPGHELVKECIKFGIDVVAVPGPCALITALSGANIDTSNFIFEGFLPQNKKQRKEVIDRNIDETRTLIFYEAPHRLLETLKLFYQYFGDRNITIAREITKIHEEYIHTTLYDAIRIFESREAKGEFVLILEGRSKEELRAKELKSFENINIKDHVQSYVEKGYSEKEAMKLVAKDRGITKRDVYAEIKEKK